MTTALPLDAHGPADFQKHAVQFSGTGGDYFRLWLSNLLLTLVTLGIYTPWARRRRVQYFYRNTLVAGDPVDFVASSRRMATSFLLVVMVYVLINMLSSQGLNEAVGVITLTIAALVPWLWRSAQRFRLGNTTWRGLRFDFQATTREAYIAAWPLLAAALTVAVASLVLPSLGVGAATRVAPALAVGLSVVALLLSGVVLIRLRFNFLVLQMTRTALGGQQGRFKASFGAFSKIAMLALAVAVVAYVAVFALIAGLLAGIAGSLSGVLKGDGAAGKIVMFAVLMLAVIPLLLAPAAMALSAWQALVFRTVWRNAGLSTLARSKCDLKIGAFVMLRTKNIGLTVITLGLYRPFAAVSEYRMKAESVHLYTRSDIDALASRLAQQKDALGDAAADMLGFDIV